MSGHGAYTYSYSCLVRDSIATGPIAILEHLPVAKACSLSLTLSAVALIRLLETVSLPISNGITHAPSNVSQTLYSFWDQM